MMHRFLLILLLFCTLTLPACAEEEALFPAKGENGLWGYINADAEWIIAPQFDGADAFGDSKYAAAWMIPEGLSAAELAEFSPWDHDCHGIIDRSGAWVLPPEYSLEPTDDGYWAVFSCDRLLPTGFFDGESGTFSGLKWASISFWNNGSRLIPVLDGEALNGGYADRTTGELVIPCQYEGTGMGMFSEGVAVVQPVDAAGNPTGPRQLINEQGAAIPFPEGIQPEECANASEGLICIVDDADRYGYADLTGQVVVAPQFMLAEDFSEGFGLVQISEDEWGYIDHTGELVLRGYQDAFPFEDSCACVLVDGEERYIAPDGTFLLGRFMDNGLAWVYETAEDGYYNWTDHLIDRTGRQVSESWSLDEGTGTFREGLQPVYRNGEYCYLDGTGQVAIKGPFLYADDFRNGLANVTFLTEEGYIDHEGNIVYKWPRDLPRLFPAKCTRLGQPGINEVHLGKWGYINRAGWWVIYPQFDSAGDFRGNYAVASVAPEGLSTEETADSPSASDCSGIIDRKGNWVVPPEYSIDPGYGDGWYGGRDEGIWVVTKYDVPLGDDEEEYDRALEGFFDIPSGYFSGLRWGSIGHWCSEDSRLIPVYDAEDYLYGYADRSTGEMVIPYLYGGAADPTQFHEGVAAVAFENVEDGNIAGWPFLINEQGDVIPLPDGIHAVENARASEGLIAITDEQDRYGFADLTGRVVIEPQFDYADRFSEGLAYVRLSGGQRLTDGEYGYIDRTGKVVLQGYQWPIWAFEDGYAQVTLDGRRVFIDHEGNVYPGAYMANGLAWVAETDEEGEFTWWDHLIDREGQQVGPSWKLQDFASRTFDNGRQPVNDGEGHFCYLDESGAVIIEGPFTMAYPFKNGLGRVRDGKREGYIDLDGNEVYFWNRQ